MTSTIPTALQTHLNQDGTTLCFLLKIEARDGTVLGVTSLDQDVAYDDGAGSVTYQAAIGVDQSAIESSSDLEVDNSEATMLLADSGTFTREKIEAGVLDYARFVIYRINWADTSNGHRIVQSGVTGIAKNADGLAGVIELRSLSQILKQNFITLYSRTCRNVFGSGGGGSCSGAFECGFDAVSLWQSHSVDTVGSETDRIFEADSTPSVSGPNGALAFVPGLIEWLTGDNAGGFSEVEAHSGTTITLRFGTEYTIQSGDTFRIRPDCDKAKRTCIDDYDNFVNFNGESEIPLGDESSNQTPGAAAYPVFPGLGGAPLP
jgi:uncharacterized phage protein (TIGR02218 family)